jgi:CheY-like chemotaxis protein
MKRVYLVDDDGAFREVLSRRLRQFYDVKSFPTAHAVIPEVAAGGPDLMISDVQMPGMSGLDLVATVRQAGSQLPVILITGYLTPEVEQRARELDVVQVVQKPVRDFASLCALIAESIEEAERRTYTDLTSLDSSSRLSHELRTPLTALKLALDGLDKGQADTLPPDHRRLVDIGQRNVDRIIRLVESGFSDLSDNEH